MKRKFLAVLTAMTINIMPAATLASTHLARVAKLAPLEMQRLAQASRAPFNNLTQQTVFKRFVHTQPNATEPAPAKCSAKKVLTHALAFGCGTIFGYGVTVADLINNMQR